MAKRDNAHAKRPSWPVAWLNKGGKSWEASPGTVVPLHGGGQELSEIFRIRWELTLRSHVASIHTGTNCSNPWGHQLIS